MTSQSGPPRKPRLSLQIQPLQTSPVPKPPRGFVNSQDPTSFNTLSNVYVTAIERSSQLPAATPLTAINTLQAFSIASPVSNADFKDLSHRVVTPYVASYPETPLSATCTSPRQMEMTFPSVMTATPPLSAGADEPKGPRAFPFSPLDTSTARFSRATESVPETRTRRRAIPTIGTGSQPPYNHPRSLHSILRNSPLPPRTAIPPPSPRRQSQRLAEKSAKRVEYNNPLTQDIVTNRYIRSHIDLLCEDGSPLTPSTASPADQTLDVLDVAMKLTPNEIQDGGQTPGPFEEMRRRMAGLQSNASVTSTPQSATTPLTPSGPTGIRKRKKREKKRQWRWTIGQEEEQDDISGAEAAVRAAAMTTSEAEMPTPLAIIPQITCDLSDVPTPTIETTDLSHYNDSSVDVRMTDDEFDASRATSVDSLMPSDAERGTTPATPKPGRGKGKGDTPIPELASRDPTPQVGAQRDTPVPEGGL